jgi:hypothetical protein
LDHERLRELERAGKPRAQERADEPEGNRDQAAAMRISCNGLSQAAANSGDEQKQQEVEHGHVYVPAAVDSRRGRFRRLDFFLDFPPRQNAAAQVVPITAESLKKVANESAIG